MASWAPVFLRTRVVALIPAVLLAASCLPPIFDTNNKARVADKVVPTISIASPQDGSPYSSAIQVRGIAKDLADPAGTPGHVASLRYEVLATGTSGTTAVAPDGSFDFTFLADSLHGPITLRLTAVDWNGNTGQLSVALVDSGNGVPGFTVTASSGSVTLAWPAVPLVDHYELYYETNDMLPSEQFSRKVSPVSSGYALSGLANGQVHAFLLKSIPAPGSGAAVNWSAVQKVIPLSPVQLVPRVQPASGSITVSWTPISAGVSYEVWKGTTPDTSGFVNVSGTITGSTFTDSAVQAGMTYYYAVKPAQYSQLLSWATPAMPSPFPQNSRREIANVTTAGVLSGAVLSADGRYLYVVDGQAGIVIYDVSTPWSPVKRGTLPPTTQLKYPDDLEPDALGAVPFVRCALSSSGYLMAISWRSNGAADYGRVSAIDVSNPDSPQEVASCNTASSASLDFGSTGLAVYANRLLVNESTLNAPSSRMEVFDFDPAGRTLTWKSSAPVVAGSWPQVEVSSDGAYAYSIGSGVEVFSVNSSTGALTHLGALATGSGYECARYFLNAGSRYLYLGTNADFRVINVTTAGSPSLASTWSTGSQALDIQVSGGRAYLSTGGAGLLIYDVNSPLSPAAAGSYPVVPSAVGSAANGTTLYLALGSPMRGFKVLDVVTPTLTARTPAAGSIYLQYQAITDRYVYATNGTGLDIYDIGGASWPQFVTNVPTPVGGSGAVAVSGKVLVTGADSVSLYDITSPLSPVRIATVPVPDRLVDLRISGSLVYAACDSYGLKVIDISNPYSPRELGSLAISNIKSIATVGSYVLVAHQVGTAGWIAAVDVSDPLAPRLINDFAPMYYGPPGSWNYGYDIETVGTFAYVAAGPGGLLIFDYSNPLSPIDKGHVSPSVAMQDYMYVAVQGQYAFVSRSNSTLSLIDVSNPSSPSLVSSLGVGVTENPKQVVVSGNRVLAASYGPVSFSGLLGYLTK